MVYNYPIDEKKKFIEYINNRSKQNRLSFFRKKYWNSKKHEINRDSLQSLDFTDKVEISSKGSYDELPLDQDGNQLKYTLIELIFSLNIWEVANLILKITLIDFMYLAEMVMMSEFLVILLG